MIDRAHGLKTTCYLWDQWEDSSLATLAPPIYPLSRLCIVTIMYVKIVYYVYVMDKLEIKFNSIQFNIA